LTVRLKIRHFCGTLGTVSNTGDRAFLLAGGWSPMNPSPVPTAADLPALPAGVSPVVCQLHRWLELALAAAAEGGWDEVTAPAWWESVAVLRAALPLIEDGRRLIDGVPYWRDSTGRWVPESLVSEVDQLIDQVVRPIAVGALSVSAALTRLKTQAFADCRALLELLAERHGTRLESARGNYRLYSFDRAWRIEVAAQDRIDFSPQIEVARTLFRQWLDQAEASPEVKAIVARAWDLDETGRLRVREIVRLANYRVEHPLWRAAMKAVQEAMFVVGSQEYLRVHRRNGSGGYDLVTLDFASAPRKTEG